jgi:glutamate synthase domain-containing protein 2/nitrite reductase/ring-hydroxylating ferredoxin subunit
MTPTGVARWSELGDRAPTGALVANVDLVIVRVGADHSVLYGRCLHRGALMADGTVRGNDLVCGLHGWDYSWASGISAYDHAQRLHRFTSWVDEAADQVMVDVDEIAAWELEHPQPFDRDAYQGDFQDPHGSPEEPFVAQIRELSLNGLSKLGHHGPMAAMGVPRDRLPAWDSIQIVTAQLATRPLLDDEAVGTDVTIGASAARPLRLEIPLFVSDMSFGALSLEAKVALARGAHAAGTGICSGEGGMLPEEQAENTRYFYELASARFGWSLDKVRDVQAFHFKFGQGAKTGTGGHLPGNKVVGRIAQVRGLPEGTPAVSPATFPDLRTTGDYREVAAMVRETAGGIPIGAKLSAQRIEADLDAALDIGVDYVILDGRGGGTGAAPLLFRDHISVPTIPALARARRHLDRSGSSVTLVITGGLRTHTDFVKALALGADAVAISNAALQAIGCIGMRACNSDNCPVGIATQKPGLRRRLVVEESAQRLTRFLDATVELMTVLARACGHRHVSEMRLDDLTTFDREMHHLAGVPYGGLQP